MNEINLPMAGTDTDELDAKYAKLSLYTDTTQNTGRKADTTVGDSSHTEGSETAASGDYSHAEGYASIASGAHSHAEGYYTTASGDDSHVEGSVDSTVSDFRTTYGAFGKNSHAEGRNTTASGATSHAEGSNTTASGAHSHAEGYYTTASNSDAHAEGANTKAYGATSHAEGYYTTASADHSHAEGYYTTASIIAAHAEGANTKASYNCSHAEGSNTTASGFAAHAEGRNTTASNYGSHACGKYNATMTTGGSESNTTGTAFVIGKGTSSTSLANAFSVMYTGITKCASTFTASTTADYAEFFEWADGNPDNEDRVGKFVTLDGENIKIADPNSDYILGIVSGAPFVLGNGDCDTWNGMYLRDYFNRVIMEPAPKMEEDEVTHEFHEVYDESGNLLYEGERPKLNPDYDYTQPYISRFDRKEWEPIGMLGVLSVCHDGTLKVNGYCTVAEGGIATACNKGEFENCYRVIKVINDNVARVIFK